MANLESTTTALDGVAARRDRSGRRPDRVALARPPRRLRFLTATSLFDGHDAAINVIRRVLQSAGTEVVHLGHNRSVQEIVDAAIQEDVQGIAVSSYQGGHVEFFRYMVDLLKERGAAHIRIFGGGGGVIVDEEVESLQAYGVARVFDAETGQRLGLRGMIEEMLALAADAPTVEAPRTIEALREGGDGALARLITAIEQEAVAATLSNALAKAARDRRAPVVGVTGTGGAGKSSLTDELVRRIQIDQPQIKVAVLAVDPTQARSGGALLGDRIRMNALRGERVYFRSLATRAPGGELPASMQEIVAACRAAGFDIVIVETAGIGQADAAVSALADVSLYVMTPEFGAASQLEKINMLAAADLVAINKFDRTGAEDALRDVRKQVQRNREAFDRKPHDMPVYGTNAARFGDQGVTALYFALVERLRACGLAVADHRLPRPAERRKTQTASFLPQGRQRHLAEVAALVRRYHEETRVQAAAARDRASVARTREMLAERGRDTAPLDDLASGSVQETLLEEWRGRQTRDATDAAGSDEEPDAVPEGFVRTPSGTVLPRVALPRFSDAGDTVTWLREENLPGDFPFTAGVFPLKRSDEEVTRMFAGEGSPQRTNARFKYLAKGAKSKRLSTAFDSVTLYGQDPHERPDIYGKIGNAGVSVATLDDMKELYAGFDLCDPRTSVSMTINGPAPTVLAMFMNTALDQRVAAFETEHGRPPGADERRELLAWMYRNVRGTVQADILKEDQGQNTCLFSTEFSLKLMGDVQEHFIANEVRRFYSVSVSGYHIAEAGANPIHQLAFTLANGFTYVEAWHARGMAVDDFAPNLSFFFSSGMDPEYAVLGRVARRIWAIAMRDLYGADERSQKLKYHTQTSGRSLHAQEYAFNDIRTTLQALNAVYDHTNSLHTNAYDEAVTTPTEESVRRAMAIQMIIAQEWGLARNENPWQGSFFIERLTGLVEEAVLREFERIAERGGVLGAMERGYQRSTIQDDSLAYETAKHDGSLPLVGVNTFLKEGGEEAPPPPLTLQRSTDAEKDEQIRRLRSFHARNADRAPAMLERLKQAALAGENVFAVLMEAVRCCSLGQITDALFEVGGEYRRNL